MIALGLLMRPISRVKSSRVQSNEAKQCMYYTCQPAAHSFSIQSVCAARHVPGILISYADTTPRCDLCPSSNFIARGHKQSKSELRSIRAANP